MWEFFLFHKVGKKPGALLNFPTLGVFFKEFWPSG